VSARPVVVATVAAALVAGCGGSARDDSGTPGPLQPLPTATGKSARPKPHLPAVIPGRGAIVAYLPHGAVLHRSPSGPFVVRIRRKTEFGSPRVLAVVGRRGDWLAVVAPELANGRIAWLNAARGVDVFREPYSIEAFVSRRLLVVRRDGRVVTRTKIAVGRPAAPTPLGRFAVTDKLRTSGASPYGCCILALSAHQPRIPQGWGGGDRIAIHATPSEETIGEAVSTGCMRAPSGVMRRLVGRIPIGTPVVVRA
jgi:hypothetical protein